MADLDAAASAAAQRASTSKVCLRAHLTDVLIFLYTGKEAIP